MDVTQISYKTFRRANNNMYNICSAVHITIYSYIACCFCYLHFLMSKDINNVRYYINIKVYINVKNYKSYFVYARSYTCSVQLYTAVLFIFL